MSEPNLNANPIKVETRERFDLKKHVHDESAFFSGVKMLISVIVSIAALAIALLGGTYLMIAGTPPDFYQKPAVVTRETDNKPAATVPEKSVQDKVTELMEDYRTGWNSGEFPSKLTASGFTSRSMVGKVSTNTSEFYDGKQSIQKIKVMNISQISEDELSVTVNELSRNDTGIKNWFDNAGGTDQVGDLVVERVVENEYRLINSGGWKMKSREWKRHSPALVQQAGEASLSFQMDEGTVQFDDRRPSKESLDQFYKDITGQLQAGLLGSILVPSDYTVTFDSGGSIDRTEIQGRLDRLKQNVSGLAITYQIESVEQTGPTSAEATVRYSAEFVPVDSTVGNKYVAVWRDQDNWVRQRDTDTFWTRTGTKRLLRSPIWQHYEAKTPPVPPAPTETGLPNGE